MIPSGPGLASRSRMTLRVVVLVAFLVGCSASSAPLGIDAPAAADARATDANTACPADPDPLGRCTGDLKCAYSPDAGRTRVCSCAQSVWGCSDCGDFMSPTATCTTGENCKFQDWEHGCMCNCGTDKRWHCTKETIGSSCPP